MKNGALIFLIIWDEYKHGEEIFKSNKLHTKKWQYKELKCVVKYMFKNNYARKKIREKLYECCNDDIRYLTEKQKVEIFNKLITQAKKEKKTESKTITIFKSEIEIIKSLKDKNLEKTLFLLLVYCKWLDNMKWFALLDADLYREAKLTNLNSTAKLKILYTLVNTGLLKAEVKQLKKGRYPIVKQMWNLPFLQETGEVAFEISNYTNVIFRYINYIYGGYFECMMCGGMFVRNANNQKRCTTCAKRMKNEQNKGYLLRKAENAQNPDV